MKWVEKRIKEVLRSWRANEIGLDEAMRSLVQLGFSIDEAMHELTK